MNQRRGWEDETSSRAVNAQPWDPPPGMLKRQCPECRYWFAADPRTESAAARTAPASAAGPRQRTRRNRGGLGIRFIGRSGFQPAMVLAHSLACALSVTPGNSRRSSIAAANSPRCVQKMLFPANISPGCAPIQPIGACVTVPINKP